MFILNKISQDITCADMHDYAQSNFAETSFGPNVLDLASTAGCRTISDLFGVSVSFGCNCIKEVCEAIRRHFSNTIKFPKGAEVLQVRDILSGNKNPPSDKMSSKLKVLLDKTDF